MIEPPATPVPRTVSVGACPACLGSETADWFRSPDRMHGVPGDFRYRRCSACGTVFQDPRVVVEDLGLLYPADYYTHAPSSDTVSDPLAGGTSFRSRARDVVRAGVAPGKGDPSPPGWAKPLVASRWLRERAFYDLVPDEMLPRRRPAGRSLDVGCGNGDLMVRLAGVGWSTEGVEVDEETARVAGARTGRNVRVGDVASLDPAVLGTFDLITLSHVFEHLPDPRGALRSLESLLSADGRLVLMYPNPESLGARAFGSHWFALDAPRHLVLPPVRATVELCRSVGLDCRGMRTLARWGADHSMQSRAYRRGDGLQDGRPGLLDRVFGAAERALMALGADLGEEIIMVLERAR